MADGEWNFSFLGDPATIDLKQYQQELLKIHQRYRHDPKISFEYAIWFDPTENQQEPADNIFAKFTYECERCVPPFGWHCEEPGVVASTKAWWVLYQDPTKFQKGYNNWSDIHARCSPIDFIYKSIPMQRHVAVNFPEHFQAYLGDDMRGHGDCEFYWGLSSDEASMSDNE